MYVYLSRVYTKNSEICAIEIVKFSDTTDMIFETIYKDKIYKRLKEIEEKEPCTLDFSYTQDNRVSVRDFLDRIEIMDFSDLPEEKEVIPKVLPSLYSLLTDLCDSGAGYCYDLKELDKGSYIPSFNQIRVSETTMSISVPMNNSERGWFSKSIVSVDDDGSLIQQPFYCLFSEGGESIAKKYNLINCGECKYEDNSFHVYKYDCTLPLCNSIGRYVFCGAVICHYKSLQEVFQKITQSLKCFINKMTDFKEVQESVGRSSAFKRVNPKGCYFNLVGRETDRDFGEQVFNKVVELREAFKKANTTVDDSSINELFKSPNVKASMAYEYSFRILNEVFNYSDKNPYDALNVANRYLDCYRKAYMKICLYLYNVRVSCLYNQSIDYRFKIFNSFIVEGGFLNSRVEVKLK